MASSGPLALVATRPALAAAYASISRPLGLRLPVFASRLFHTPARHPRTLYVPPTLSRQFANRPVSAISPTTIGLSWQRRNFGGGSGISRSLLATREATANRNPNSATSQNAFYQLLLKANMPAIVVERYQSGLYASNEAGDAAYVRALEMMKHAGPAGSVTGHEAATQYSNGNLSTAQLQAVAQAVAAQSKGGNMAASVNKGTGSDQAPLHVIVEESKGSMIFRWVKASFHFALIAYMCLMGISLVVGFLDNLDQYKRAGGKSHQTNLRPETQKAKFSDVHGCDEAKDELVEVVEFLRNPAKFSTLGGKLPKGVLLVGPPGTGKTLLARAVAGESGVPFFYMSGSEFDEMFVGVGAKRVRDLFNAAKEKSPSIIFIDELDAIGGKRNARDASYVKQTLNQLLTELDGFQQNTGVIVLAATNHPQLLDKALTRPGRFDRHVVVDLPDVRGRLAILQHHAKKVKLAPDVKFSAIAGFTTGLSGAELENIVNSAAVRASKAQATAVKQADIEWAMDKVIMGAERKIMTSPEEKLMTAYHEAGHALVHLFNKSPGDLHKVTILARARSLGHTSYIPEMDKYSYSLSDYLAMIQVAMGGKIAEELAFGPDKITSGVSNDLEKATSQAFAIISKYGMSTKLAPMDYSKHYEHLSTETRAAVEAEVQRVLAESAADVRAMLTDRRTELDRLAHALVDYETLDREEVLKVIKGEPLTGRTRAPKATRTKGAQAKGDEGGVVTKPPGGNGGGGLPEPEPRPPAATAP